MMNIKFVNSCWVGALYKRAISVNLVVRPLVGAFCKRRVDKTRLPLGNKSGLQTPPTIGYIFKLTPMVRFINAPINGISLIENLL